jgi:Bacterial protein of unknown function (DUF916)
MVAIAVTVPLLGVLLAPPQAGAITTAPGPSSNYQFSVEPYSAPGSAQRSEFNYELQPGHTVLDQVVILNTSSDPETFTVYPEDATNEPQSGGFGFEQQGQMHNTSVGTWVTVGQTQFTIPAGKEAVDTFQLAIPANAVPGDHVGAIVVQQLHPEAPPQSKEGVNLVLRFAVPMYVRVVGPVRPAMTIENVTVYHQSPLLPYLGGGAKVAVRFTVVNTGNVILTPTTATVSITAPVGGTIHQYTVHRGKGAQSKTNPLPAQMLPGGRLVLTELWSGLPPFVPLTAHVSATASEPSSSVPVVASASVTFWYLPWLPVLIVVVAIGGLIFLLRRRKRLRLAGAGAAAAAGAAPDTAPADPESSELSDASGGPEPSDPPGGSVEEVGV